MERLHAPSSKLQAPGFGQRSESGLILALAFILLFGTAVAGPAASMGVPAQILILTDGVSSVYAIADNLLVVGSESVYVAGRFLERDRYLLDYARGTVLFWDRLPAWTPVRVAYRCIRLSGRQASYSLYRVAESEQDTGAGTQVVARVDSGGLFQTGGLELSGTKTVGVTVGGAEGTGLDQSTRLAISGQVEGITVDAELSDQSSAIPPEGTTRDIEELDRLLISLRGEKWRGSFGDVDLTVPAGSFGTVSRRVVGATMAGGTDAVEVSGGYATPKGQFGRIELAGEDGSQGPYVLAPDGRSAVIVAGSEEVYLDGRRMTRGWDADYTIDYSTGELVFTNHHIITSKSRIEASFQYVTEAYSRSDVTAAASYRPAGVDFGVRVLREGDDQNRSLLEEYTDEDKAYLGSIGADTGKAWLDGGRLIGQGQGDYMKEGGRYRYVGQDSGDYEVRFSVAGESLGDYAYDDTLFAYRYVGARAGDYVARVKAALPERQDIAYAQAGFRHKGLGAMVEGAFRNHSRNLFAPDGATIGAGALNLDAGWQDSSYGVRYQRRMQGTGFELPGMRPAPDFSYRWGGATEQDRLSSDEVSVRAQPVPVLSVAAEAGRLTEVDDRAIMRYAGNARLGWLEWNGAWVADIMRQQVQVLPRVLWLYPKAGWQHESRPDERNTTWTAGAGVKPAPAWSLGTEYQLSDRLRVDSTSGLWQRESRGNLVQGQAEWTAGEAYRLEAMAALQNRHYDHALSDDWSQMLASTSGSASPLAGLRLHADFSQSYRRVQLRDELFEYVGPGLGEYRRDTLTGGYVYDPDGDYERTTVATGRFAAAKEWSLTGSGDVSLFRPVALSGSCGRTQASADSGVLTDAGRYDARLTVRQFEPAVTPTIGTAHDFSLDRTLAATGRASSRDQGYVELYSDRVPEVEGRLRFEVNAVERVYSREVKEYSESGWRAEAAPILGDMLRLEIEAGYERKVIEEPLHYPELGRFAIVAENGSVARTFTFGTRTRLRAAVELVHRRASVAGLPFDVILVQPPGWTPGASLDFEHVFSTVLSASVRYGFSNRPDRAVEHRFSSEIRAYF